MKIWRVTIPGVGNHCRRQGLWIESNLICVSFDVDIVTREIGVLDPRRRIELFLLLLVRQELNLHRVVLKLRDALDDPA